MIENVNISKTCTSEIRAITGMGDEKRIGEVPTLDVVTSALLYLHVEPLHNPT